jgi:hypothetical protein
MAHLLIYLFKVAASSSTERPADPLTRARQAFNLACVEQLVPVRSHDTIGHSLFPLCLPYAQAVLFTPCPDSFAIIKASK